MIAHNFRFRLTVLSILFSCFSITAQDITEPVSFPKTQFYDLRGTNAIDAAIGTSVINGDFVDPMWEIYSHIGYKRHFTPYLAVDIGYHKFNLAYIDIYNEGFMSFDLNMEVLLRPHHRFSPYIFAGAGYNAANHFSQSSPKVQGGIGIEYVVSDGVALKLYSDYNYVSSDTLDGLEAGAADDVYWRIAFGVNFYFGGAENKAKALKDYPTIKNTYSIIDDENNP